MKKVSKSDSNEIRPEDARIGALLVAAREAAGFKQTEVAVRAGWFKDDEKTPNQQRVSHYEIGRRRISVIDLIEYAKAIGVTPAEILGMKKIPTTKKR